MCMRPSKLAQVLLGEGELQGGGLGQPRARALSREVALDDDEPARVPVLVATNREGRPRRKTLATLSNPRDDRLCLSGPHCLVEDLDDSVAPELLGSEKGVGACPAYDLLGFVPVSVA